MKAVYKYIAVVFTLISAGLGQTVQTFTVNDSADLVVNAKAGQVVTVSAVLETTEVGGDTRGDTLVISLPFTTLTVSEHFIAHSTTFVAQSDNPTVTAQLLNGNGHQAGRITFAQSQANFTQSERNDFALLSRLYSLRGLAGQAVGRNCADGPCLATGTVIATGAMSQGKRYSDLVVDSDDPNFATVLQPAVIPLPSVQPGTGVTQAQANAFNAWALNEAQEVAFAFAIRTAFNRANTAAARHGDITQRQLDAAGSFAIGLASLLNEEPALRNNLVLSDQAGGFQPITIVASEVTDTETAIHETGLSQEAVGALQQEGYTTDQIAEIASELFCKNPNAITPFLYPNIIIAPRVNVVDAQVTQDLLNIALRVGVPLGSGEAVTAIGSVAAASGSASLVAQASLAYNGEVAGQFQMTYSPADGSAAINIQTDAIRNVAILGPAFLMTGNFTAPDGSTQSFFLAANRADRSVIFGTSNGVNVTGNLRPGRITDNHDTEQEAPGN